MYKIILIALLSSIFATAAVAEDKVEKSLTPDQAQVNAKCSELAATNQLEGQDRALYIEQCKADLLESVKENIQGDKE